MNENEYPWSPIFAAAVLETDSRKLAERVSEAACTIDKRLSDRNPMDLKELQTICDAKAVLYALKRERRAGKGCVHLTHGLLKLIEHARPRYAGHKTRRTPWSQKTPLAETRI
jgi:hypothetical protein